MRTFNNSKGPEQQRSWLPRRQVSAIPACRTDDCIPLLVIIPQQRLTFTS
jgi:hypothetical protein